MILMICSEPFSSIISESSPTPLSQVKPLVVGVGSLNMPGLMCVVVSLPDVVLGCPLL